MEKQSTIAATMATFMATGPSVTDYPTYKSLNDHVGSLHGLPAGKCQALAGPKAWAWHADTATGVWRKAAPEEAAAKAAAAAGKAHGTRGPKVLNDTDRAALDSQIAALEAVANPALAPLLTELTAKRDADDVARKGSLRDRLAAAVEQLGLARAVELLEAAAEAEAPAEAEAEAPDAIVDRVLAKAFA